MGRALLDATRWAADSGCPAPPVHVNVFSRTIASESLPGDIAQICAAAGRSTGDLVVEVAEDLLARDGDAVAARVSALAAAGIASAIDDVGSDATALRQLASAGFALIKLDAATLRSVVIDAAQPTTLLGATLRSGAAWAYVWW